MKIYIKNFTIIHYISWIRIILRISLWIRINKYYPRKFKIFFYSIFFNSFLITKKDILFLKYCYVIIFNISHNNIPIILCFNHVNIYKNLVQKFS